MHVVCECVHVYYVSSSLDQQQLYASVHIKVCACMFVGSCLATKVFIGNLPAMGRGWVIIE